MLFFHKNLKFKFKCSLFSHFKTLRKKNFHNVDKCGALKDANKSNPEKRMILFSDTEDFR